MWQRVRQPLLVLCWVIGLSFPLIVFGCGYGGEGQFSPDSFEFRGVSTFSFPYVDRTLLSFLGDPYRQKIVQFWLDQGYLKDYLKEPKRWDMLSGHRAWQRRSFKGEAASFWWVATC